MKRLQISPGFFASLFFLAWLSLDLCRWVLLGILCHEAGHLLLLILCRVPVQGIRFRAWGAVLLTEETSYQKELLCALAGPAASIALGAALMRSFPHCAVISFLFAAVNLLPLYPLDGGRALRCLLLLLLSQETAERILKGITILTCCALMVLACWVSILRQAGLLPIFAALLLLCRAGEQSLQVLFAPRGKI